MFLLFYSDTVVTKQNLGLDTGHAIQILIPGKKINDTQCSAPERDEILLLIATIFEEHTEKKM